MHLRAEDVEVSNQTTLISFVMKKLILVNIKGHTTEDPWMPVSQQQQKEIGGFWASAHSRQLLTSTGGTLPDLGGTPPPDLHTILTHYPCSHCFPIPLGRLQGWQKEKAKPKYAFARYHKRGFWINPKRLLSGFHDCWNWETQRNAVHKLHFLIRDAENGIFTTFFKKGPNSASKIKIPLVYY